MRRQARLAALLPALLACLAPAVARAQDAELESSLYSGEFDDRLMLVADHAEGLLAGYYDDGRCRFYFRDRLDPGESYQRRDLGETYRVASWSPETPGKTFVTEIYSVARGGYSRQVTLEPDWRNENTPPACGARRFSIDRANHVSGSFIDLRVVAARNPALFQMKTVDGVPQPRRDRRVSLKRGQGVWVGKTYSPAYSPAGHVNANWYESSGKAQAAYIRERDLYPLPAPDVGQP